MKEIEDMMEVSEEDFQANFDEYMELIESKQEYILVRRADGTAVIAAPITEDLEPLIDVMPTLDDV